MPGYAPDIGVISTVVLLALDPGGRGWCRRDRHDRLDRVRDVGVETRLPRASQVATLDHERNARCPRW